MHNKNLKRLLTLCLLSACVQLASAASPSRFVTESRLNSGRWVKISVANNGIYEITAQELAEMGFSDPARVAVYGDGGHMISEVLDGTAVDDLQPVASMVSNGKLYFYGKGAVRMRFDTGNTSSLLAFQRDINAYSTHGHYFLTEEDNPVRVNVYNSENPGSGTRLSSSYNYWYHEQELYSLSRSGKELLGEDMLTSDVNLHFELPLIASPTVVIAARCAGASGKTASGQDSEDPMSIVGNVRYNNQTSGAGFPSSKAKIFPPREEEYYNTAMPHVRFTFDEPATEGDLILSLRLSADATTPIITSRLDHAIITYQRQNSFVSDDEPQFEMWFDNISSGQVIALPDAPAGTLVWDVSTASTPVCYTTYQDGTTLTATTHHNGQRIPYIAFDPNRQQYRIDGFEEVAQQNLHGLTVPDLLIVTNDVLMEQACRLADIHRYHDGMTVHVVDQQQVFNEFSSGTPDAMAIRLLCKMFYNRNPQKFKNLLMFGPGLYDNRQLTTSKPNTIITFESTTSNDETTSYPTDDFFGFLEDGSGESPARSLLCIGVGRMIPRTPLEAKNDVDKLEEYVTSPDYGVWRNNVLVIGDEANEGVHIFQAEGINNIIETEKSTGMHSNKVYVQTFPRAKDEILETDVSRRSCTEGKRHLIENLTSGQYFGTYVGHAGGSVLSGNSKLWYSRDVNSTPYSHWPILTTACCNIARFDSNQEGIAEAMYHQRNGGAIALLTAARDVKSDDNDNLNRAFTNAFFSYGNSATMPTLGEVYKQAKRSFGTSTEHNKLAFFLLGDPAIRINYPRPLFNITSINGEPVAVDDYVATPMQRLTVEAEVTMLNGYAIDQSFNGDATMTLYGPKRFIETYMFKMGNWYVSRDIYQERPLLGQVEGKVVNGRFTGSIIMPRNEQPSADGETLSLSLYAHKNGSTEMVNGSFDQLLLSAYDETNAETDSGAPVIEAMYLNDEQTFAEDASVNTNSILYVRASDDLGFNLQTNAPGAAMRVMLDGNKQVYYTVKNHAVCTNDGRDINVAFPLNGLSVGPHTLAYYVQDLAGNTASQTISFTVVSASDITLTVDERPASTHATFAIANNNLERMPMVALKVTDAQGRLVWNTTTSEFPLTWDLKDNNGQRVPAGLYKFFGSYQSGDDYGGTNVSQLVVIDPLTAHQP